MSKLSIVGVVKAGKGNNGNQVGYLGGQLGEVQILYFLLSVTGSSREFQMLHERINILVSGWCL